MSASEAQITGFGPKRSSRTPAANAPAAAATFPAIPKRMISEGESPYTVAASTAPKPNTPASPSW